MQTRNTFSKTVTPVPLTLIAAARTVWGKSITDMKNLMLRWLAALAFFILVATTAVAAIPRTYVSINGIDANPCTRDKPCREITRGIDEVLPGGEVVVLDTGDYEPFTVDRSVTVGAADGASPGISITSGKAVAISAGASEVVTIRGLTLKGTLNGPNNWTTQGIAADAPNQLLLVAALHVEDCTILYFGVGITAAGGPVYVKNTVFRGNIVHGLGVGSGKALIENCRFENNGAGLRVGAGASVTMHDSALFGNVQGVWAFAYSESRSDINIENCVAANNKVGIQSDLVGTVIHVANSTITNNTFGLHATGGGQILSRAPVSNTVLGNESEENFTGSYGAK